MAAGWMTRACALAIATAACFGLPAALAYAIVRVAAARRFGATFALAIVLVFWVTISLAYYPRVCCDIVPWSALLRRLRRIRHQRAGEVAAVAAEPPPILPPPLLPGGGAMLAALPREPAAAARGGEPSKRRCAVCLCDVEKGEAAAWLPACLHMYHQDCIDQWLHKHGHSTCPICRSDAFAAPPLLREQTVVTTVFPVHSPVLDDMD